MQCPNCDSEMEYRDKGFYGQSLGEWDVDPYWHPCDTYECKACNIKNIDGRWEIPARYETPTLKQINAIYFICRTLGLTFEPLLKRQCWKFINEHFGHAKAVSAQDEYDDRGECEEWM